MVECLVLLAEGTNKGKIDLSCAHLGDFFGSMKIDFLNQAGKLVDVILHTDGRVLAKREEGGFSDVASHIGNVAVFFVQT